MDLTIIRSFLFDVTTFSWYYSFFIYTIQFQHDHVNFGNKTYMCTLVHHTHLCSCLYEAVWVGPFVHTTAPHIVYIHTYEHPYVHHTHTDVYMYTTHVHIYTHVHHPHAHPYTHLYIHIHTSPPPHTLTQIGDNVEIMYFAAKSSKERDEWLEACRAGMYR